MAKSTKPAAKKAKPATQVKDLPAKGAKNVKGGVVLKRRVYSK